MPHDYCGALRRGCCFISVSMQSRRICHAPPAKGILQAAPGGAVIAPQHRRAVTSSISFTFAERQKLTHFAAPAFPSESAIRREPLSCAAGFRLKSVDGREQVSLSTAQSSRPMCQTGSRTYVDRSASLSNHLLKLTVSAACPVSLVRGFCAYNTVYSVFNVRVKVRGKCVLHLTCIRRSCLHFGQWSGKFINSVSALTLIRVLFPQAGQHTHLTSSIQHPQISLCGHTANTDIMKINEATTMCCFQVRLRYPTNSRIRAFRVKYHFVFAPKPMHFSPCCFAKSSARNT